MISILCSVQTLLFSFITSAIVSNALPLNDTLQTTVTATIASNVTFKTAAPTTIVSNTPIKNATLKTAAPTTIVSNTPIKNATLKTAVPSTVASRTLIKTDTTQPPVINGNYSEWSDWFPCDVTCLQKRNRTCSNPPPKNGGSNCTGEREETIECNTGACPMLNGNYSDWTEWSDCKKKLQNRTRMCDNPVPRNGGRNCSNVGVSVETQACVGVGGKLPTKKIMIASLSAWGVLICIFMIATVVLQRKRIHNANIMKKYKEDNGKKKKKSDKTLLHVPNDIMEEDMCTSSHLDTVEEISAIPLLKITEG